MVPSLLLYRYLLLFPSEDEPAASLEPEIVQLLPSVQTEFASLLFPSKAAFLLSDFPENNASYPLLYSHMHKNQAYFPVHLSLD